MHTPRSGKKEKDASWFSPKKRASPMKSPASKDCTSELGDDPFHLLKEDEDFIPDALELADLAERGISRAITTRFTTPVDRMQRTIVMVSEDKSEYRLFSDAYDFLLYARVISEKQRIDILGFDPATEEPESPSSSPSRPPFSLVCDGKFRCRLVQDRCDHCQLSPKHTFCTRHGKQQLANVRRFTKKLGSGVCNCMDVNIPALDGEGNPVIWCPLRCTHDATSPQRSDRAKDEALTLVTKCPSWNAEFQCLVLEFAGRTVTPSPENFQLTLSDQPDEVVCQYGKIGPTTFGLDFKPPMNIAQAFGLALSAAQAM